MGKTILYRNLADYLVYIPCGYNQEKDLLDNDHRLKMLKLTLSTQYEKYLVAPKHSPRAKTLINHLIFTPPGFNIDANINLDLSPPPGLSFSEENRRIDLPNVDWTDPHFFENSESILFVDDIELRQGSRIPTSDLIREYQQKFGDIVPIFVGGADLPPTMFDWEDPEFLFLQPMICRFY